MTGTPASSILWRRLDRAGHEAARVVTGEGGPSLEGSAVFEHDGRPCRPDYLVACDTTWATLSTRVSGWIGDRVVDVAIAADHERRWRLNGAPCDGVNGCLDVDLHFSPSTNLLAIRHSPARPRDRRRSARTRRVLRFPDFQLEVLEQVYRRTGRSTYRYESAGGRFIADLEVHESGLVTRYPGLCETVSVTTSVL